MNIIFKRKAKTTLEELPPGTVVIIPTGGDGSDDHFWLVIGESQSSLAIETFDLEHRVKKLWPRKLDVREYWLPTEVTLTLGEVVPLPVKEPVAEQVKKEFIPHGTPSRVRISTK
jgi:hypothetical protein